MQPQQFKAFDVKDQKGAILSTWQLPEKPRVGCWAVATKRVNQMGLLVSAANGPQVGFYEDGTIYLNNWAESSIAPVYDAVEAVQTIAEAETAVVPEAA